MTDRLLHFKIHGMDCAEEVTVLKREVGPVVGGENRLSFDILNGKMTVTTGTLAPQTDAILAAVGRTGMRAEVWQVDRQAGGKAGFWDQWVWWSGLRPRRNPISTGYFSARAGASL